MNYYGPREQADANGVGTGLWLYTRFNRRLGTAPVGYCADGCPGHPTAREACDHYKQYLLDHSLRLDGEMQQQQQRCRVCQTYTDRYAEINHHVIVLCDQHRTREQVAELFEVGNEWSSD